MAWSPLATMIHDDVIKWKHFMRYWPFVRTKASDAELWCFFDLRLNKRLSKESWCWWFETTSCSLWRHCNDRILKHNLYFSSNNVPLITRSVECKSRCLPAWLIRYKIFFSSPRPEIIRNISFKWCNPTHRNIRDADLLTTRTMTTKHI